MLPHNSTVYRQPRAGSLYIHTDIQYIYTLWYKEDFKGDWKETQIIRCNLANLSCTVLFFLERKGFFNLTVNALAWTLTFNMLNEAYTYIMWLLDEAWYRHQTGSRLETPWSRAADISFLSCNNSQHRKFTTFLIWCSKCQSTSSLKKKKIRLWSTECHRDSRCNKDFQIWIFIFLC